MAMRCKCATPKHHLHLILGFSKHFGLAQHATKAELSNVCSNVGYLVGMLEEALKHSLKTIELH